MTITIGDILAEIKRQLALEAHDNDFVMLTREQADYLHLRVIELLNELDGLRAATEDMRLETLRQKATQKEPGPDQHLAPVFHIEHDRGR